VPKERGDELFETLFADCGIDDSVVGGLSLDIVLGKL